MDKAQFRALLFDEAFIEALAEYFNYSNVFLAENVTKLLKNSKINEHAIELKKDKQLFFGLIYSLGPVELKMLKTYIKTNLANRFIRSSKSPVGVPIFLN